MSRVLGGFSWLWRSSTRDVCVRVQANGSIATATYPQYEPFQLWQEQEQGTPLGWACAEGGEPGKWVNISSIGTPYLPATTKCSDALSASCPRSRGHRSAAGVIKCDACAGKSQPALKAASCTASEIQEWCAAAVAGSGAIDEEKQELRGEVADLRAMVAALVGRVTALEN